jgi:hypothetical protein
MECVSGKIHFCNQQVAGSSPIASFSRIKINYVTASYSPQLVYYYAQFKASKIPLASASFVPVKVAAQGKSMVANEIKLSLPNGFQCSFPSNTDTAQIKRLVEVLLSC